MLHVKCLLIKRKQDIHVSLNWQIIKHFNKSKYFSCEQIIYFFHRYILLFFWKK